MGATNVFHTFDASSAEAGFRVLADEARYEYGNDYYNGSISNCYLHGYVEKVADKYSKTAYNKACKIADKKLDRVEKRCVRALDCGVIEYRSYSYKRDTSRKADAPKYATRYVLETWNDRPVSTKPFETVTEAKQELTRLARAGKLSGSIVEIVKKPVLVSGSPAVGTYVLNEKVTKTKPKSAPKDGWVEEIHRYVYYGWAPC